MPANLNIQGGEVAMMYVDKAPWHGLGTKLDKPPTSLEAILAAKLDWQVVQQPIFAGNLPNPRCIPGKIAIVRADLWKKPDCPVFGIVGKEYTPLQNKNAFDFFDPIIKRKAATYETAGALGEGERVWILAKLATDICVGGKDTVNKYLLLSNSHDGNSSVQIKFTPIRVVCQNTLTLALSYGQTLRVSHTKNLELRLKKAEKLLGLIDTRFGKIEESFQKMALVSMNSKRLAEYMALVFPTRVDLEDERASARAKRDRAYAEHLFDSGKGNKEQGVAGTLWAAYNGVTEYIDHRGMKTSDDRRLESVWFGDGYLIKARAFRIAESKINVWLN